MRKDLRVFVCVAWLLASGLVIAVCGCKTEEGHLFRSDALRVGVIPGPAEEVLHSVEPALAERGVKLKIVRFADCAQSDVALVKHDIDAGLCQSSGVMEQFNHDHQAHLVSLGRVYVPLMAIYPGVTKSLDVLADGARIAVPNDPVNHDRALLLLGKAGLLQLARDAGASTMQIVANPKFLKVVEMDPAKLPLSLTDVDLAVFDADYALSAGLNPQNGSLLSESGTAAYANVLAVTSEAQLDTRARELATAVTSARTRSLLASHFGGAVEPPD